MGQDASTHPCVAFAIIISILSRPEFPKKQLVQSVIQDFLLCSVATRSDFLQASKDGQLLNLPSPIGEACDLCHLPGYMYAALNPATNPRGFHIAWDGRIRPHRWHHVRPGLHVHV